MEEIKDQKGRGLASISERISSRDITEEKYLKLWNSMNSFRYFGTNNMYQHCLSFYGENKRAEY